MKNDSENYPQPPAWMLRFFRWFCHPDFQEDIEGDLLEMYDYFVKTSGLKKANWAFFWEIISLLRLNLIRPIPYNHPIIHFGMYKNYFKIAWRSLFRQKLYAAINIGGLAIGLTCFLLIFLYLQHELSYDRFYPEADQIYRIYQQQAGNDYMGSEYFAVNPAPMASTLMQELPEVEVATSIQTPSALLGRQKKYYWESGLSADPNFFKVFAYKFLSGNAQQALKNPQAIVLTETFAKKMFGKQNPLGKRVNYQNYQGETARVVAGVIADPPQNSSLQFAFVVNLEADKYYQKDLGNWTNSSFQTILKLKASTSPGVVEQKIPKLIRKHVENPEEYFQEHAYLVQPLSEIHLDNKINFDIGVKGNPQYIYLFSAIAVLVLLLACVNYTNLAIARSMRRAQEVGLRKVVGALRRQLISQFLSESILISFLAFLLAMGLVPLLLPTFGNLLDRSLEFDVIQTPWLLPGLILLVLVIGLISGSYPALLMSSLHPVQILKGNLSRRFSKSQIQRVLIVGQYTVSITLIISSLIFYRQFQFIQDKELGYNKEHVLTIKVPDGEARKKFEVIKAELSQNPHVLAVTGSGHLPTNISSNTIIQPQRNNPKEITVYRTSVEYSFLEVFGIELIAGRNFSPDFKTDLEKGYLINETAAKALGYSPEEAVGKEFTWSFEEEESRTIVGVVKDFHLYSMHLAIEPMMLHLNNFYPNYISLKVRPENLSQTVAEVEAVFQKYSHYPFEYAFLDEQFDRLYQTDVRLGEMFGFFTLLSVAIASLGLFGLAAFSAERRTKEIGIRKVLGASIQNIVALLSQDFLKMVLIGFVIAIPIAWYAMHQWLQDFAYRIEIQWWMFALAGIAAVVIALVTISYQSIKAALANPVDSLRNE